MPSEKQYRERRENIAAILTCIRSHGPQSRRQLSTRLELSWGCISELVSLLLTRDILREDEPSTITGKGRTPTLLRLNTDLLFLGIDINTSGLSGCVCDLAGGRVASFHGKLAGKSREAFADSVITFTQQILDNYPGICGIGFAMQGIYDALRGEWDIPLDTPTSVSFEADIAPAFSLPLVVEHDPNCILYGYLEDARDRKMIVRLDRGIGAAVYAENRFLEQDLLEIGYLQMNPQGERLHDILSLDVAERACGPNFDPEAPSESAKAYFATAGFYLGMALGNICNLLRLDEIYLCGSLIDCYRLFADAMEKQYASTVLPRQKAAVIPIRMTDAAFGAARLAIDHFQY